MERINFNNCSNCEHQKVCGIKEKYQDKISEIEEFLKDNIDLTEEFFSIEIKCKYYNSINHFYITNNTPIIPMDYSTTTIPNPIIPPGTPPIITCKSE